jgi:hypothetical protein
MNKIDLFQIVQIYKSLMPSLINGKSMMVTMGNEEINANRRTVAGLSGGRKSNSADLISRDDRLFFSFLNKR